MILHTNNSNQYNNIYLKHLVKLNYIKCINKTDLYLMSKCGFLKNIFLNIKIISNNSVVTADFISFPAIKDLPYYYFL